MKQQSSIRYAEAALNLIWLSLASGAAYGLGTAVFAFELMAYTPPLYGSALLVAGFFVGRLGKKSRARLTQDRLPAP